MKVVILAGGFGTRISEESYLKPKPMIEIGGKPILWHIMKYYASFGFNEFIVCLGYKSSVIKDFFANYFLYQSDVTFNLGENSQIIHDTQAEDWVVTLVETGLNTMTGGRIKRIARHVGAEDFMLTYGDGVCDVDINALLKFHKHHEKLATLTAVKPEGRFGVLDIVGDNIRDFREKSVMDMGWINGGFMVLSPKVIDYIDDDSTVFEQKPLERLAQEGQLVAYKHKGFWQCMDTQRDKIKLEELWQKGQAAWKIWD